MVTRYKPITTFPSVQCVSFGQTVVRFRSDARGFSLLPRQVHGGSKAYLPSLAMGTAEPPPRM